jgi:two-component system, NtrC family, sensor kinase
MTDPSEASAPRSRQRPARSYRELSQQILLLASKQTATTAFIGDIVRLLSAFTACDELEIWILRLDRRLVGWRYFCGPDSLVHLGNQEIDPERISEPVPKPEPPEGHASATRLTLRFGSEFGGWIDLHSRRENFFHSTKQQLYEDIALTLGAAVAYQRAQLAQRERVKELSCLYQIARLSADQDQPIDELLTSIVSTLPPGWLHADVAAACIQLDEHRYATDGFDRILQELRAPITIAGQRRGHVSVGYFEKRSTVDNEPFLEEEQSLLNAAAQEIARNWERRQAADDRARLHDQLRHADRLATIGQLAAGVAHELNEPLGSILGFAQLANKTPDLPGQTAQDLTRIAAAALHSREIVRKLSLFARQAPARREPMNLSRVVEEGLFLLESRCRKEGIDLALELGEDLPDIVGDSGQMTQVLMNLVVNALQAMPRGGDLRIETLHDDARVGAPDGAPDDAQDSAQEGDQTWVSLKVTDSGSGIPPEVVARIFEPFYTTKDVGEGTGLGLSVVHGIVSAHGGTIAVDSVPGQSTCFTVRLPLALAVEQTNDGLDGLEG